MSNFIRELKEFVQEAAMTARLENIKNEISLRIYQQRNKSQRDRAVEDLFCSLIEDRGPREQLIPCLAKVMIEGEIKTRLDIISMFGTLVRSAFHREPDDELLNKIVFLCDLPHQERQDQNGYSLLTETEKRLATIIGNYYGYDPTHPDQWAIISQTILMNNKENIDLSLLILKKEFDLTIDKLYQGKNLTQLLLEVIQ